MNDVRLTSSLSASVPPAAAPGMAPPAAEPSAVPQDVFRPGDARPAPESLPKSAESATAPGRPTDAAAVPVAPPPAAEAPVTILDPIPTAPLPVATSLHATPAGSGPPTTPDLGDGFPSAPDGKESLGRRLHDFVAGKAPIVFNPLAHLAMSKLSAVTEPGLGVHADDLLDVERTMYNMMVPSRDGYVGGSPPIFQALAQGQAAYVLLKDDQDASDHLTRLYTGLPPEVLQALGPGDDAYTPVRKVLLERIQRGDFAAFIDVDGDYNAVGGTESIAIESISSIARRENVLSQGFADPDNYYRWLVTRVDSAFRRTDPWLYEVKTVLHHSIADIKEDLTPPWITAPSDDPLGSIPFHEKSANAYRRLMDVAGGGKAPTLDTLTDIADTAISLDRDLLFAVQTYWSKLLREISPGQRESLFVPLARTWVNLNVIPPTDPDFDKVSPPHAPYIELIDQNAGQQAVLERYDRAMALSEVVDHTLAGLGVDQRRAFLQILQDEVMSRKDAVVEREQRVRAILGQAYAGLDVEAILTGRVNATDPTVKAGLEQLRRALDNGQSLRPMTPEHAEIQRHMSILSSTATRPLKYPDVAGDLAKKLPPLSADPLIVGQYYRQVDAAVPTPLPPGPSHVEVLGRPRPGHEPVPTSVVLQGGGGKGFAYIECIKQLKNGLRGALGQVAIDSYLGTSAGAITAGLLAAGYTENEMASVMQELDFKRFYADYLWLAGGVDPQVRGTDRTGLFSTRQMYQSLSALLRRKVNVQGRPVLFRDLPFKLTVVATVLNSNLPDDLKQQLGIGKDGQIVFSSEKTPNMDAAAAICASAAVPAFFNAPQVHIARTEPDGNGGTRIAEYRLQLMDGGVVNNFPIAQAAAERDPRPFMIAVPAYYQAPGLNPGDPPVSLTTLNFDPANLPIIDDYNKKRYTEFAPRVGDVVQKARDEGSGRAVIAFKLTTPGDQSAPVVQGRSRADSRHLRELAEQVGMPTESVKKGASLIRDVYPSKACYLEEKLLDEMLDRNDTLTSSLCHPPVYTPGDLEASGTSDILVSVTAAQMVAPYHMEDKLFER